MAFLEMNYYSKALHKCIVLNVILPETAKRDSGVGAPNVESYKTLYLYHGRSGDHTVWIRRSNIERYAATYNLAVVMPDIDRSWCTDTCYGANYFTFVSEELPMVCRSYFKGMSTRREDNFVAGLSMGGYGALKVALRCPDRFFACASLSGALDITRKGRNIDIQEWKSIFDYGLEDGMELEGTCHDLYAITRKAKKEGIIFPKMYLWCGTEDSWISVNRDYHMLLTELGIEHCYKESEGDHSWQWWDLHIRDALRFLLTSQ